MRLPDGTVPAEYVSTGVSQYEGNPLIEALPLPLGEEQVSKGLAKRIKFRPTDTFLDPQIRFHAISQILDGFFQPLHRHMVLEAKLSIMLRQGYVGRNPAKGKLAEHIQNGYERVMQGDLDVFRFEHAESTAKSMTFIGCSGTGKTSSINGILATYPRSIFHEKYNLTQIVFLKIDCPHDGSLKGLCQAFFREIDSVLSTDYVRRYVQKRNNIETLLALMAHIANTHAIGILVIDEIQHLSVQRSGGAERMLNFFVTLVNEISIPVVMVGTPKARTVFESDLRSARRSAGFGSVLWEPLALPTSEEDSSRSEWVRLTDRLWRSQCLKKASPDLSDELRETWYDLSQGIMDIVVKLFVLSQIRAVFSRSERITPALMKRVYNEEFKPIHPMIEALRSGDADLISRYSDLTVPDIDMRILELAADFQSRQTDNESAPSYVGNEQAIRLHNLLVDLDCETDLLEPLVERAFANRPDQKLMDLMPLVLSWYREAEIAKLKSTGTQNTKIKKKDWSSLESSDLRFLFSQADNEEDFIDSLERKGLLFDSESWVDSFG